MFNLISSLYSPFISTEKNISQSTKTNSKIQKHIISLARQKSLLWSKHRHPNTRSSLSNLPLQNVIEMITEEKEKAGIEKLGFNTVRNSSRTSQHLVSINEISMSKFNQFESNPQSEKIHNLNKKYTSQYNLPSIKGINLSELLSNPRNSISQQSKKRKLNKCEFFGETILTNYRLRKASFNPLQKTNSPIKNMILKINLKKIIRNSKKQIKTINRFLKPRNNFSNSLFMKSAFRKSSLDDFSKIRWRLCSKI